MKYAYAVIGAGMQGVAAAYDLMKHGEGDVILFDSNEEKARIACNRIGCILGTAPGYGQIDANNIDEISGAIGGMHGVLSAVPYYLNPYIAKAALKAEVNYCDLGGNTNVTREILKLDESVRAAGLSFLPDCGLAPGLGNQLAVLGMRRLPMATHVQIRCGGLPKEQCGPLGYKLVFSTEGLINEYKGWCECIRDGKRIELPVLTEYELFHHDIGTLEACLTSGGTSMLAHNAIVQNLDYKTLRYPGHFERVTQLMQLDHDLLSDCLEGLCDYPHVEDIVILRVTVWNKDRTKKLQYDLYDEREPWTGFSAMERCTAFPAAACLHMQVKPGYVMRGAYTPETVIPPDSMIDALEVRGLKIVVS